MSAATGFRKVPATPLRSRMSVRDAVTKYGDEWRIAAGHQYRDDARTTADSMDAAGMSLMERGILPRVVL